MPSRGGRGGTSNFFRSIGIKCSNELTAGHPISFHVTTKPLKTPRRTNARAKNICALFWMKLAPRESSAKTSDLSLITYDQICALLGLRDSKSRNGKFVVNKSCPE